jgi:hypothetical protein
VEQWVRADREHWTKRDARMVRHHKLWRLDKDQNDRTKGLLVVTTNDPKVFIEKAAAMAVAKDHRIEVAPKGERNAEAAERIENACRWKRSFERRRWRDGLHNYLDYDQAQCLFLRGWLTTRVMLDPESTTFVDETMFDPLTVYPRPRGRRVARVCHVYRATLAELKDDFGELPALFEAQDEDAEKEVKSVYLNDPPYWHCVVVDGDWIKEPTELGYWPWILTTAKGAFTHHATDWEDEATAAEQVGQGFLDAMEDAYRDLCDLLTIGMNIIAKQENPPMKTTDPAGKPLEVDTGIGGRTPFATGQDAQSIEVGAKLSNLEAMLSAFQDRENKAGFPAVAWGEGAGIQSGYQSALLMGAIQDSLTAFLRALEAFHSQRYEKWLELFRDWGDRGVEIVARVGQTGPKPLRGKRAWGTVLTPQDLEANGTDVDVVYEDISPQDRMALTQMAVQLVASGLIDLETARDKYIGLDDPGLINSKVLGDLVYKNPAVVEMLSELQLRRGGRYAELVALRAADAKAQLGPGGPAPPGGPPGAAGEPPPGAAPPGPPPGGAPPGAGPPPGMLAPPGGAPPGPPPVAEGPPGPPPPPMSPAAMGRPGAGAGAGVAPGRRPPPPIPPEAIARFRALPPQLQAVIGRLPVAVAVELLGLEPRQMLAEMARLGGGRGVPVAGGPGAPAGPGGAPGMPRPAGLPPQLLPAAAGRMPATPEQLTAQRMARVGLVPARR